MRIFHIQIIKYETKSTPDSLLLEHITDKVSNGLIRSQLFIYTGHDKRTLAVHKRSFKQRKCAAASPPSTTFRLVKGHLRMCVWWELRQQNSQRWIIQRQREALLTAQPE